MPKIHFRPRPITFVENSGLSYRILKVVYISVDTVFSLDIGDIGDNPVEDRGGKSLLASVI